MKSKKRREFRARSKFKVESRQREERISARAFGGCGELRYPLSSDLFLSLGRSTAAKFTRLEEPTPSSNQSVPFACVKGRPPSWSFDEKGEAGLLRVEAE